jgi:3-(3-hydroxy-phenyl)propionate hydroxylase
VLVVGGGPVGLAAGCLLTAQGIRVLLVERNAATSDAPKAISIDDEAIRMLKLAGLGDELDDIILPGTGTQYFDGRGRPLFRAGAAQPFKHGHPFKNPFAQPELEAVLDLALRARADADVRFGCELVSLEQTADHVEVLLSDVGGGTSTSVPVDYVIAADGGRSTVRELLGIGMTGRSYRSPWLVADVVGDPHRERFGLHYGVPARPCVIIPGVNGRCRYEFLLHKGEGVAGEPPAFALTQRLIAPYRAIAPEQVERAVVYTFNAVVADAWQVGRVFLVGDAAHMMPPFAGQGLNSGLRDVGNLCWKLAGVLGGQLAPTVPSTYEAERRPHAEATLALAERLGRIVFTTSPRRAWLRDVAIRTALKVAPLRRYFEQMRYRRAPRIDAGVVIGAADEPLVGTALGQPRVFDVAAHRPRLLDDVVGAGWSLVGVEVARADWDCVSGIADLVGTLIDVGLDYSPVPAPGRHALTDLDGGVLKSFCPLQGRFALVRPDRVVAAVFAAAAADAVLATLHGWFLDPAAIGPVAATHASPSMEVQ